MRPFFVVAALAAAGCHVVTRIDASHHGQERLDVHADQIKARPATVVASPDGTLRFVEPLACTADVLVEEEESTHELIQPNLAVFVVGVIATSLGGVFTAHALASDDPGGDPGIVAGPALVAGGLPMLLGPWFGNRELDVPGPTHTVIRGQRDEPCGARPLAAGTATVSFNDFRGYGVVDAAGDFAASPFDWADAFDLARVPAWDVRAELVSGGRTQHLEAVLQAVDLARARDAFLAHASVDGTVGPMTKVPLYTPGPVRVSRLTVRGQAMLRVALALTNDGPGDAWGVRAYVSARDAELDGRILYVGHLPRHATLDRELLIPLSPALDGDVQGTSMELALTLHDAYDTAPGAPLRFRGVVLNDLPR